MKIPLKCIFAVLLTGCGPKSSAEVAGQALLYNGALAAVIAAKRECPDAWPSEGESTFFPGLDVLCHKGPGKQCVLTEQPTREWEYSTSLYRDDPIWKPLLVSPRLARDKTYFHHQVTWKKEPDSCTYIVRALGDMDGDGVFSEFKETTRLAGGDFEMLGSESSRRDE